MDVGHCISQMKEKRRHDFDEKFKKDNLLSVMPSKLRFAFNYDNFQVQEKFIKIANYFTRPCPIQFLPLETNYFKIKNVAQKAMLTPGSVFKLNISFIPNENRDYNDVLKVRYFDDQEIQIKIFATMITKFSLPATVNFGDVPLGRSVRYKIPICSHAEKEFSFAISACNTNSCVDIYPRLGRVKPRQNPVEIAVIYRPLRYVSMNFQVRIFISDLCKAPHVINFYAYTRPGLLREALNNVDSEEKRRTQQRRQIIWKDVSSLVEEDKSKSCSKELPSNLENTLLKQCSQFPLYSLHAVNCILNMSVRKSYSAHELKGPLGVFLSRTVEQKALKQKKFLVKVEERYRENEQAKFHQKPKVDYGTNDEDGITEIKLQQEQAWNDYTNLTMNSERNEREKVEKSRQRILRASQKYPITVSVSRKEDPLFHYCKIQLFVQAAYKVVLRNRLLNALVKLRHLKSQSINMIEESMDV